MQHSISVFLLLLLNSNHKPKLATLHLISQHEHAQPCFYLASI